MSTGDAVEHFPGMDGDDVDDDDVRGSAQRRGRRGQSSRRRGAYEARGDDGDAGNSDGDDHDPDENDDDDADGDETPDGQAGADSQAEDVGAKSLTKGPASLTIRLCTSVFMPLIRSLARLDRGIYTQALRALQTVLADVTTESLEKEPPETLDAIRLLLMAILSPTYTADHESRVTVSGPRAQTHSRAGGSDGLLTQAAIARRARARAFLVRHLGSDDAGQGGQPPDAAIALAVAPAGVPLRGAGPDRTGSARSAQGHAVPGMGR